MKRFFENKARITDRLRWVVPVALVVAAIESRAAAPNGTTLLPVPATAPVLVHSQPPCPPSQLFRGLTWHWDTLKQTAPGSDLWPVTWAADDNLYGAWGDGGGFGGSNSDGRVPMGFARIEGSPPNWRGVNVNGGKNPEHPASFPRAGKSTGLVSVEDVLYATVNLQDGRWPDVNHVLAWSTDYGATWTRANWLFSRGPGRFQPAKFVDFGRANAGTPAALAGYVYLCGPKQQAEPNNPEELFLARASTDRIREQNAYEFYAGLDRNGQSTWTTNASQAHPIFSDPNGVTPGAVVYDAPLHRYLLTSFHVGPSQLGVFESANLWGPWRTIYYDDEWGAMSSAGEGLTCGFPSKWLSADGLTLWSVFSVYGAGAKQGIMAHDCFNLVSVSLEPVAVPDRLARPPSAPVAR